MPRLPDRIHKRPFVVGVLVLTFILVIAGVLVISLRIFGATQDMPIVTVLKTRSETSVTDIGLNIDRLPGTNYLRNPSFENTGESAIYTVADAQGNSIFVLPEEAGDGGYANGYFNGGTLRVLSVDEEGTLVQKFSTQIGDFSLKRLGMWTNLVVPQTMEGQRIVSTASSSSQTIGVGPEGFVLADMTAAAPRVENTGIRGDLISIVYDGERFCAITPNGTFVISPDGMDWSSFSLSSDIPGDMRTVSYVGSVLVAAGDFGAVTILSDSQVKEVDAGTNRTFRASCSDGSVMLLAGDQGTVKMSANGLLYRDLTPDELPGFFEVPDWTAADARDGKFLLAGSNGEIAVGTYDSDLSVFEFETVLVTGEFESRIAVEKAVFLPSGEILLLDTQGNLYCSDTSYQEWKMLTTMLPAKPDSIGVSWTGKILLTQGESAQLTGLYTEVALSSAILPDTIRSGDMCLLSVSSPSISMKEETGTWQAGGEHSDLSVQIASPSGGGTYSARITGNTGSSEKDAHFISQKICDLDSVIFQKNKFYQLQVWMKQSGIANQQVMAWISGGFTSFGTTFTDVGGGWRLYTYTFLAPDTATVAATEEIRINIGFYGAGELYIDKTYLGLEANAETAIEPEISTAIRDSSMNLIRLENVQIARKYSSPDGFLQQAGNESGTASDAQSNTVGIESLEASLTLVRDADADPWIVIGPMADELTIQKLMGYLCGDLSDPYGKLRADNGTGVPWGMQFDRMVFEINDTDGVFRTDIEKSAYVNYVIALVRQSADYLDVQDKIIFLDGMEYIGKSMLSDADGHTWDVTVSNVDATMGQIVSFEQSVADAFTSYYDQIPRIPFAPNRPANIGEEWARSFRLNVFYETADSSVAPYVLDTITAADYTYALLFDYGKYSSCLMADLSTARPVFDSTNQTIIKSSDLLTGESLLNKNQQTLLNVISILSGAAQGNRTEIITDTSQVVESSTDGLSTFAYSDEESTHFIAVNISNTPIVFNLEADWPLDGDLSSKYGSDGALLESMKLANKNNRITLMPGQVFIAEITYD